MREFHSFLKDVKCPNCRHSDSIFFSEALYLPRDGKWHLVAYEGRCQNAYCNVAISRNEERLRVYR